MTHSVGDRGSFRPQAGSIPTEPEINWRDVYPGQWRHEHGYIWADSIKGGNSTPAQVRGWGYLTGHGDGALALTEETAARIQNEVGAMIAAAPEMLAALEECARVLAMLTEPESILSTSVGEAWAASVTAEIKVRKAIFSATGQSATGEE